MKRLKRWHKIVLVLFIVLVVVPVTAWVVLDRMAAAAVRREEAKIRAAGEPVTWRDLVPPPMPDSENAAVLYDKAFALLSEGGSDTEDVLVEALNTPLPWSEDARRDMAALGGKRVKPEAVTESGAWAAVRARILRNTPALDLIHQAAAMPLCRFEVDYSANINVNVRQLWRLRAASRLLGLRAQLRRRDGDIAAAYDDVVDMLRLERATHQPVLFSYSTGGLLLAAALNVGLKPLVAETADNPDAWRRLLRELDGVDRKSLLITTLQGERVLGAETIDAVIFHPSTLPASARPGGAWQVVRIAARPLWRFDKAHYLACMGEVLGFARTEPWQASARFSALLTREANATRVAPLTRLLLPARPDAAFRTHSRTEAWLALGKVALALHLYKHEHGAYPAGLGNLVPDLLTSVPPDPFTGNALVYRRVGAGFILYSVGSDGTDNGGNEKPPDPIRAEEGVDIVWKAEK